ncbi:hypothetical protein CEXT_558461 [Caerostris extrusa]|uniref:Uncharacterized protein n=1 Tax=Caerostris extrusa TaxID=172846 RepID=A0AAV4QQ00_CAEEX|nr:hypothetical protein CEXT_558461 [Caerostris extrusa]
MAAYIQPEILFLPLRPESAAILYPINQCQNKDNNLDAGISIPVTDVSQSLQPMGDIHDLRCRKSFLGLDNHIFEWGRTSFQLILYHSLGDIIYRTAFLMNLRIHIFR